MSQKSLEKYDISVVMPALNEEKNLVKAANNAIEAFDKLKLRGEIVIVNDGSVDQTASLAAGLCVQHGFVKVVTHSQPMGIGRSFWDGVKASSGEAVTLLPGDAENDGNEILRYFPLLQHVDIVVPFVFNREARSWKRRLVSKVYKKVINWTFGTSLNYMNGTVLYRRNILQNLDLRSSGFFYQTELLIRCLRAGYLYAEVPSGIKRRVGGVSKALRLSSFIQIVFEFLPIVLDVRLRNTQAIMHRESISARRREQFKGIEGAAAQGIGTGCELTQKS